MCQPRCSFFFFFFFSLLGLLGVAINWFMTRAPKLKPWHSHFLCQPCPVFFPVCMVNSALPEDWALPTLSCSSYGVCSHVTAFKCVCAINMTFVLVIKVFNFSPLCTMNTVTFSNPKNAAEKRHLQYTCCLQVVKSALASDRHHACFTCHLSPWSTLWEASGGDKLVWS